MEDVAVSNSQQRISSGSLGDVAMSGTSKSHDRTPKKVNRAAQQLGERAFDGLDSWAMLCPGTNFNDFIDLSRTLAPISQIKHLVLGRSPA